MVTSRLKFDPLRLKRYLRENLGVPFVVLFQAFLVLSGGFLIQGYSSLADTFATYSYYSLVIAVALQLFSFLIDGRRKQK